MERDLEVGVPNDGQNRLLNRLLSEPLEIVGRIKGIQNPQPLEIDLEESKNKTE